MLNTTFNIKTAITESLMKVKLTADTFANCPNVKVTSSTNPTNNNDGYDNVFCISVLSHEFLASDGEIAADCAELSFEIALHGCAYSKKQGWSWDSDNGYTVNAGEHCPNLIIYNDGSTLSDLDDGNGFLTALKEDESIGEMLANHIVTSTPNHRLMDAFKHILVRVQEPSID